MGRAREPFKGRPGPLDTVEAKRSSRCARGAGSAWSVRIRRRRSGLNGAAGVKKGASSREQLSPRDTEWSRTLGEVVAARSSASASFVRWWTRTTQPPPVRRASSGCIRKTVGDNHGIGELSSQRFSVPSCGRTSVTGSGRLRGVLAHKHPSSDICGVSQLRRSGLVAFCRPKA